MQSIPHSAVFSYNGVMDSTGGLDQDGRDVTASPSPAALEAFGTLLADLARFFAGCGRDWTGGPGIRRRMMSVLVGLLAFTILMLVRFGARTAQDHFHTGRIRWLRHLSRPPAGWAAP